MRSIIPSLALAITLTAATIVPRDAHAITPAEEAELARLAGQTSSIFCKALEALKEGRVVGATMAITEMNMVIRRAPAALRSPLQHIVSRMITATSMPAAKAWMERMALHGGKVAWPAAVLLVTPWDYLADPYGENIQPGMISVAPMDRYVERWASGDASDPLGECDPDLDLEVWSEECDPVTPEELLEYMPEEGPMGDPDGGVGEEGTGPLGGYRPLDIWNVEYGEVGDPYDTQPLPNSLVDGSVWLHVTVPVDVGGEGPLCFGARQRWDGGLDGGWNVDSYEVTLGNCLEL